MSHDLAALVAGRFHAFAAPYLDDPGDDFAYRLKIDHTLRVLDLAETICREERVAPELTTAARLAALMHDVGRFPQYRAFRTFRDADSANHAALSVQHALRAGMLRGVPADIRRLVLGAVFLHNRRSLPPLPDRPALRAVARIVRDSDKLDIYGVMLAHFSQEKPEHPEVALNVIDEPGRYTPAVLHNLLARNYGDYRTIVYVNDFKLMTIGWLYDLNFRSSARILRRRRHLDALFDSLPDDADIRALRAQVREDLALRCEDA